MGTMESNLQFLGSLRFDGDVFAGWGLELDRFDPLCFVHGRRMARAWINDLISTAVGPWPFQHNDNQYPCDIRASGEP